MYKKKNLLRVVSYLIGFIFIVALSLFAILREEGGKWEVDFANLWRLIPFIVIYLLLEFWLFPVYMRTRRWARYMVGSLVMVTIVTVLWMKCCYPFLPKNNHERTLDLQQQEVRMRPPMALLDSSFTACLHQWIDADSLNSRQVMDSCQAFALAHPDNRPPKPGPPPPRTHFFGIYLMGLTIFAFFTTIHFLFRIIQTEDERKEAERMRVEAELKQLRYQLNPHFLMNTLNNIHALIEIDAESAQESVRVLSKMMRYMLKDANKEKVELAKEVEFISNYLMQMRKRYIDVVDIAYEVPSVIPDVQIPPAILVNLVENSFKHGISYQTNSFVRFFLTVEDDYIICQVRNSKSNDKSGLPEETGVGVENIRKRLDILYPGRYVYKVTENAAEYHVELKIPIR